MIILIIHCIVVLLLKTSFWVYPSSQTARPTLVATAVERWQMVKSNWGMEPSNLKRLMGPNAKPVHYWPHLYTQVLTGMYFSCLCEKDWPLWMFGLLNAVFITQASYINHECNTFSRKSSCNFSISTSLTLNVFLQAFKMVLKAEIESTFGLTRGSSTHQWHI